jgi:hypothetical protein
MSRQKTLETCVKSAIERAKGMPKDDNIWAERIETRSFARFARHGEDFLLLLPSSKKNLQNQVVLANLIASFGLNCQVSENGVQRPECLTILRFRKPNDLTLETIGDVVALLLKRIKRYSETALADLIDQLIELFHHLNGPSDSTVKGLWGELATIYQSSDPTNVARSWHSTPLDRFDFSHRGTRIEVKTTSGPRQHTFSYEQLIATDDTSIIVASLIITEDAQGLNIYELTNQVIEKLTDELVAQRVLKVVVKTIGQDKDRDSHRRFDLASAISNLRFYDSADVPKPPPPPPGVFQIRFKSDLQLVPELPKSALTGYGELGNWLN